VPLEPQPDGREPTMTVPTGNVSDTTNPPTLFDGPLFVTFHEYDNQRESPATPTFPLNVGSIVEGSGNVTESSKARSATPAMVMSYGVTSTLPGENEPASPVKLPAESVSAWTAIEPCD